MRHLGSLLAGLVITPLAWMLIAAGQARTAQTFDRWSTADRFHTGDLLGPLGLLAGAGVLLGLIAALRLSPVGPIVGGLVCLGVYGYAFRDPIRVLDLLPRLDIRGYEIDTTVPFTNGTMALIGALLVMAALSRRRWQRWPRAAPAGADDAASEPGPPGPPVAAGSPATVADESGDGTPAAAAAAVAREHAASDVPPPTGPLPPVSAGPLWPSTAGYPGAPSRTSMEHVTMSPGTAEDLPRRTMPKRPAPEPRSAPDGAVGRSASGTGQSAPAGPRHAAAPSPADNGEQHRPAIQPMYRMPQGGPAPADPTRSPGAAPADPPRSPGAPPADPTPAHADNQPRRPAEPPPSSPATPPANPPPASPPPADPPPADDRTGAEPGPPAEQATSPGPADDDGDRAPGAPNSPWERPPRPTQE